MNCTKLKKVTNLSVITISSLLSCVALPLTCSGADAVEPKVSQVKSQNDKPYAAAMEAFNKAISSGDASKLDGFLSDDFVLGSVPAEHIQAVLPQLFKQVKGRLGDVVVTLSRETKSGYELELLSELGPLGIIKLDNEAKFLGFPFFGLAHGFTDKSKEPETPTKSEAVAEVPEKTPKATEEKVAPKRKKSADTNAKVYAASMAALNKALNSGDVADLDGFISEGFAFKGVPEQMTQSVLTQGFIQTKGTVSNVVVEVENKTATGYELELRALEGKIGSVTVDEEGNFLDFGFFGLSEPSVKTVENESGAVRDTIPFELTEGGLMTIDGRVNGVEGKFIIDTGAPLSVLNANVIPGLTSEGLGSNKDDMITMSGKAKPVLVNELSFGEFTFNKLTALYQPIVQFPNGESDVKILGMIGYQELGGFEFLIDYENQEISFFSVKENGELVSAESYPEANSGKVVKFKFAQHLPVIECKVGELSLLLAIDSGASQNHVSEEYYKRLEKRTTHKHEIEISGFDNAYKRLPAALLSGLTVDGKEFGKMVTVFSDTSRLSHNLKGVKCEGIVGYPFLSQSKMVRFNYKKKEVTFW